MNRNRASWVLFLVAAFLATCWASSQIDTRKAWADKQRRAMQAADEMIQHCQESRKAGRLKQAEQQCLAAIQISKGVGWPAQGYTATLGMIYWEQGEKRLGFVTLRDAYEGYHGSPEFELFLGRMAIDLSELGSASDVVRRFREKQAPAGSLPNGTRQYWPAGNDAKSLQAVIEFLEGDRLCQTRETKEQGIKLLKHADKLIPENVAINFALADALAGGKDPLSAAPYYRLVAERAAGGVRHVAGSWLARHKKELANTGQPGSN